MTTLLILCSCLLSSSISAADRQIDRSPSPTQASAMHTPNIFIQHPDGTVTSNSSALEGRKHTSMGGEDEYELEHFSLEERIFKSYLIKQDDAITEIYLEITLPDSNRTPVQNIRRLYALEKLCIAVDTPDHANNLMHKLRHLGINFICHFFTDRKHLYIPLTNQTSPKLPIDILHIFLEITLSNATLIEESYRQLTTDLPRNVFTVTSEGALQQGRRTKAAVPDKKNDDDDE